MKSGVDTSHGDKSNGTSSKRASGVANVTKDYGRTLDQLYPQNCKLYPRSYSGPNLLYASNHLQPQQK